MSAAAGADRLLVLRTPGERLSLRVERRPLVATVVLAGLASFLCAAALMIGEFRISPVALLQTLAGEPPDPRMEFFVLHRRLPRALVALCIGAALACGGALFQRVTRNPLASPDLLGISSGAAAGACTVILLLHGSPAQVSLGALAGAAVAALTIGAFALRGGMTSGRIILAGLAFAALASATTGYLLTRVFVGAAVTAQTWLVGSLQGRGWTELLPLLLVSAVVLPVLLWRERVLAILEFDPATTTSLGAAGGRERALFLACGVVLVAFAVAAAGPISFIALAAPHISRAVAGSRALLPAALTGGILLLTADLLAQFALPVPVPVGVVTIVLGGAFFLSLLLRQGRRR
ncbi:FecCD family ABC transporter permease [Brevibacterium album]|uniref:FecCD family ABC transporter permease n=1 Tax=Brevibacterium album TaxID=417948 RepID=UPI0003F8CD35|nr:iron chelate uptake ABC transporter family permease subunit [Brevibacterium album]